MTEPAKPAPRMPPPIDIHPDLSPVYANLVRIAHTPSEMLLDFARLLPGQKRAEVQARVMMSPLSAKLFYRAMGENLAKYEAAFGEIRVPGDQVLTEYSKLFRPPPPDDPTDPGET